MLSAQFSKVLSDVTGSKTRTVLIVLSIMAGLVAVGTVLSARVLLSESVDASYGSINFNNGSLVTAQSFDKDLMRSFDNNNLGVEAVDGERSISTRAINPANKKINITISTKVDYGDMRVNTISSKTGEWPPSRHNILIESASMAILGVKEGDEIQIETQDKKLRTLKISGTVVDLSSPPASMMGAGYAYVDEETLEWLGAPAGYNQLKFTVQKDSQANVQSILDKVVNRVENGNYTVVSYQVVSERPVGTVIQTLLLILGAIGVLSLGLCIFLIINTVSSMVVQQTSLIGVMKAVGGGSVQILWMYLAVAVFYGVIALVFSIPISILGSQALSQFLASSFNFSLHGNPFQISTILIQTVMALLVPTLSSLFPLINGLSISATQALTASGTNQANNSSNLADRLLSGTNLWFARYVLMRPVLMALRNVFRQKVRLILTLVTLIVAGAVFITIFNLRATIFDAIDKMTRLQSYDMEVDFSREYRIDEIQKELSNIKGVQAMDTWNITQASRIRPDQSEETGIVVTGLHPDSKVLSAPEILSGRWLVSTDQNALVISSALIKNEPDIKVGQDLTLKINDRDYTFHIVGLAMTMGTNAVYTHYDYLANLLGNKTKTSTALLKLDPKSGISTADEKTLLDSQLKSSGYLISSVQTISEIKTNMENTFNSIIALLIIMALLLAVVGGLGLMGTMSINVIERTREIGVMRAIGSSNKEVNNVFIIEGVTIGIISCLIAIPISFPITSLAASTMGSLLTGTPWAGSFAIIGSIIWIILVVLISLVANYFPARSASRLTVREVLAYE